MDDFSLGEWAEELQYALAPGPDAWAMVTVATYETAAAAAEVIETPRNVVAASGLPIIELDPERWLLTRASCPSRPVTSYCTM